MAATKKKSEGTESEPIFFESPDAMRKWFAKHHQRATDVWVGFHKRHTSRPSVTWPESVDEALCVGWIDGIRKSIDEISYKIRFSPRRSSSIWSSINIRRVEQLKSEGRMLPAGMKAFEARRENRSGVYSYENRPEQLDEPYLSILKKNRSASEFFHT